MSSAGYGLPAANPSQVSPVLLRRHGKAVDLRPVPIFCKGGMPHLSGQKLSWLQPVIQAGRRSDLARAGADHQVVGCELVGMPQPRTLAGLLQRMHGSRMEPRSPCGLVGDDQRPITVA